MKKKGGFISKVGRFFYSKIGKTTLAICLCSLLAVGFLGLGIQSRTAKAELWEVQRILTVDEDAFTVTAGASVDTTLTKPNKETSAGGADTRNWATHGGLLIEPKDNTVGYNASLNALFTGDTRIDYSIPGFDIAKDNGYKSVAGHFVFHIRDAADATKGFDIGLVDAFAGYRYGTAIYIRYGNEVFTSRHSKVGIEGETSTTQQTTWPAIGTNGGGYNSMGSNLNANPSYISLKWEKGNLCVYVPTGDGRGTGYTTQGTEVCIAVFDGGDAAQNLNSTWANGKSFGLPKMDFPAGFTVSFETLTTNPLPAENNDGTTVSNPRTVPALSFMLEKITMKGEAINLGGMTLNGEPEWYADSTTSFIATNGAYKPVYLTSEIVNVKSATYMYYGAQSGEEITDVSVKLNGSVIEKAVGDALTEKGKYDITYTYGGVSTTSSFYVVGSYYEITDQPVIMTVADYADYYFEQGDVLYVNEGSFIFENIDVIPTQSVESIILKKGDTTWDLTNQSTHTFSEVGDYTLTYTAVDGRSNGAGDNQITHEFRVVSAYEDLKGESLKIDVSAKYADATIVNLDNPVYPATFTFVNRPEVFPLPVAKIEIVNGNGEVVQSYEKLEEVAQYAFTKEGTYTIRYIAILDNDSETTNVVEFEIEVYKKGFNNAQIIEMTSGNATVISGDKKTGTTNTEAVHNGILVRPADASDYYKGKILGEFSGDTRVDFSFPGNTLTNNASNPGHFIFTVSEVDNPGNSFKIGFTQSTITPNGTGTAPYVEYSGGMISYLNGIYSGYRYECQKTSSFGQDDYAGESYFLLKYVDGKLNVILSTTTGELKLAVFDGTKEEGLDKTEGRYGLPLMPFENGYEISFECSSYDPQKRTNPHPAVAFKLEGITTGGSETTFESAVVEHFPSWYSGTIVEDNEFDPKNRDLDYELVGEYPEEYIEDRPLSIYDATYGFVDPIYSHYERKGVYQVAIYKDGVGTALVVYDRAALEAGNLSYTFADAGRYKIVYTAMEDNEAEETNTYTIEIEIRAKSDVFDYSNVLSVQGATVVSGYVGGNTTQHTGILVQNNGNAAYSGGINMLFTGNTQVNFAFPGETVMNGSSYAGLKGHFIFRIKDAKSDASFELHFQRSPYTNQSGTTAYIKCGSQVISVVNGTPQGSYIYWGTTFPIFGQDDYPFDSYFSLEYDEKGILGVYGSTQKGKVLIAKFDGTNEFNANVNPLTYGLPKMPFADGYTISFESTRENTYHTGNGELDIQPIVFESIITNRETRDLSLLFAQTQPEWFVNPTQKILTFEDGKEYDEYYLAATGVSVKAVLARSFVLQAGEPFAVTDIQVNYNGTGFVATAVGTKFTNAGTYVIKYTYDGVELTDSFVILNSYYELNDEEVRIEVDGEWYTYQKNTEITVPSGTFDFVNLPISNISVEKIILTLPDGTTMELTNGQSLTLSALGEYTVEYYAFEGVSTSNGYAVFKFEVIESFDDLTDEPLEIAVEGEYYDVDLNMTVEIYAATYTFLERPDIQPQLVAKVRIEKEDGTIVVADSDLKDLTSYTFTEEGTFRIVYTAMVGNDGAEGNEKSFTITVTEKGYSLKKAITVLEGAANVTPASKGSGTATHNGLLIEPVNSTTAYNVRLNAVFSGDTTINYSVPGELLYPMSAEGRQKSNPGHLVFHIQDVTDPSNGFDVGIFDLYGAGWLGTSVYVKYKGNTYIRHVDNKKVTPWSATTGGYPFFGQDDSDVKSYIKLRWDGRALCVYAPLGKINNGAYVEGTEMLIAKFDGTEKWYGDDYGLPYLDFPSGYTISIETLLTNPCSDVESKFVERTVPALAVRLESIVNEGTTTSLDVAKFEEDAIPVWIEAFNTPFIALDASYKKVYLSSEGVAVVNATYRHVMLQEGEPFPITDIKVKMPGSDTFEATTVGTVFNVAGVYTVRYTIGNVVLDKTFEIVDSYFVFRDEAVAITLKTNYTRTEFLVNDSMSIYGATFRFRNLLDIPVLDVQKIVLIKPGSTMEIDITDRKSYTFDMTGKYVIKYYALKNGNGEGNTFEKEFMVYSRYSQFTADRTIDVEGVYSMAKPGQISVWAASYSYAGYKGTPKQQIAMVMVNKDGEGWQEWAVGTPFTEIGSYEVKYIACTTDSTSNRGNEVTFSFEIVDDGFDISDVITIDSGDATVTVGNHGGNAVKHDGLLITPKTSTTSYSGTINSLFSGANGASTTIVYSFPGGTPNPYLAPNGTRGHFEFRITDATNPNNYFIFQIEDLPGRNVARYAIRYKDQYRTLSRNGETIYDYSYTSVSDWEYHTTFGQDDVSALAFKIVNENGIFTVYYGTDSAQNTVLARFDGTTEIDSTNGAKKWGLEKIAFPNGYKISFASYDEGDGVPAVRFERIADAKLDAYVADISAMSFKAATYEETVRIEATKDVLSAAQLGLGINVNYLFNLDGLSIDGYKWLYPDMSAVDLSAIGAQYTFNYEYLGQIWTQTLEIYDAPPVLQFADGMTSIVYRYGAEDVLTISENDVIAVDRLDGTDGITFTLQIKAPGGDFVAATFGAFTYTDRGVYEIKYVATDKAGNAAEIIRLVTVVDGVIPEITLESSIPTTATLKSSISLPVGSAKVGDIVLTGEQFRKYVYLGAEKIALDGDTLTFAKAGVYTVSYFASYEGKESLISFEIMVEPDDQAPILQVGTIVTKADVGATIQLGTPTATDIVDGDVDVQIVVYYGKDTVAVSNGKFVAEVAGVYVVRFLATDETGNTACEERYVSVGAVEPPVYEPGTLEPSTPPTDSTEPSESNGSNEPTDPSLETENDTKVSEEESGGCSATVGNGIGGVIALMVSLAALMIIRKRKGSVR